MCSYGVVINGTAMVRKNENYHLIHYISLISSSPPHTPLLPPPGKQQDAVNEGYSTVPGT